MYPSLFPCVINDRDLNLLDRHRVRINSQHTGGLARCRTKPARKLGKIVRCVQALDGFMPTVFVDQIIPIGNDVSERTAVIAERNTTIHAPAGLVLQVILWELLVDLFPVQQSYRNRPASWQFAIML
ncbi:unannotated protein [freshwater metagenome]|uniref:Unannotated protein n=1 Tax=freshwater metagenome TaxID=449393 RepID=A0A6J7UQI0_9ZZZZ